LCFQGGEVKTLKSIGALIISSVYFWAGKKGEHFQTQLQLVLPSTMDDLPAEIPPQEFALIPYIEPPIQAH
jgi:hypothetical protein